MGRSRCRDHVTGRLRGQRSADAVGRLTDTGALAVCRHCVAGPRRLAQGRRNVRDEVKKKLPVRVQSTYLLSLTRDVPVSPLATFRSFISTVGPAFRDNCLCLNDGGPLPPVFVYRLLFWNSLNPVPGCPCTYCARGGFCPWCCCVKRVLAPVYPV